MRTGAAPREIQRGTVLARQGTHEQFKLGIAQFIGEHFGHGDVLVLGDDPYERYLASCSSNEWPVTVFIEATHDGRIKRVEQLSATRG